MTAVLEEAYSPCVYYTIQPGPGLPDRFAYLIGGLCHALGAVFTRDRSRAALSLLVHARLRRLSTRFAALVARVEAGILLPARVRVGPRAGRTGTRVPMPSGFGWLCRLMPEGNVYAAYLEDEVLPDARLAAVLEAAPHAAGMLRPVLWMMGREAPERLRLPRRAPRPKVVAPEPVVVPGTPYRAQPTKSHYPSSVWPTEAELERAGQRLERAARRQKTPE